MENNNCKVKSTNFWTALSTFQKWFLVIFGVASVFSFISPVLMGQGWNSVFTLLGIIGFICSISGVIASIYQARAEIILYAFLLTNTVTYGWVSWENALYGQVIQNIILLLPIQIAGLIAWKRNLAKSKNKEIQIKKFTAKKWIITIIALFICWGLYYLLLVNLPNIASAVFGVTISPDASPVMDSLTTVLTVMAMILTSLRYIEQWYFWIICNIGVVLFIQSLFETSNITASIIVSDFSGMINWVQYGVGAIYGFYLWRKMYNKRQRG